MGLWKPKEVAGEGNVFNSEATPQIAGENGEGTPVFLGHELVKHMMAPECLGSIGNARFGLSL